MKSTAAGRTRKPNLLSDEVVQLLWEAADKKKGYADYWDWPDKPIKERAVVKSLLASRQAAEGVCWIRSLHLNPDRNVAPDVIGADVLRRRIAFEVTELVDKTTVERNKMGFNEPKEWEPQEFRAKLQSRLVDKDGKQLHYGPYHKYVVVVHTDEPLLPYEECNAMLAGRQFGPFREIDEAYLLFSPPPSLQPGRDFDPYIQLTLTT